MELPRLIPLEQKDIKKLKRRKLFMHIFWIYMSIVSFGTVGFSVWLYYFNWEEVVGLMMGAGSLCGLFVVYMLHKSWKSLKSDLYHGVKEVIHGEIQKKYSHKNNHELTINDFEYKVNYKDYIRFKKGENVLISYAPKAKIILDIYELSIKK